MSVAHRLKTNAQLCAEAVALPEPQVGEVIDGVLHVMSRPDQHHAEVEGAILSHLKYGRGGPPPTGWYIQHEVEVRFANDELCVPDVSGWRAERMSGHLDENPIRVTPDWVCEVLSSSTRKKDLGPKRDMYARQGVGHLWLVDPDLQLLEAFTLGTQKRWELLGSWADDAEVEVAPFTGVKLRLSEWWLRPR